MKVATSWSGKSSPPRVRKKMIRTTLPPCSKCSIHQFAGLEESKAHWSIDWRGSEESKTVVTRNRVPKPFDLVEATKHKRGGKNSQQCENFEASFKFFSRTPWVQGSQATYSFDQEGQSLIFAPP
jgi:hypothetical protein